MSELATRVGTVGLCVALLLSGCATNALRVEYAANVAEKAKSSVASYQAYLVGVETRRVAFNIDVIGYDPDCVPNVFHMRKKANLKLFAEKYAKNEHRGWLCGKQAGSEFVDLAAHPFVTELQSTLRLLEALGVYANGVAKIVKGDGESPLKDFENAHALAVSAGNLLDTLIGLGGAPIDKDDPRVEAIKGFAGFLLELKQEQDQVKQLRKYLDMNASTVTLVSTLKNHLAVAGLADEARSTLRLALASDVLGALQASTETVKEERRREAAILYYKLAADTAAISAMISGVQTVLDDLQAADDDLRRIIKENPQLTLEERRKRAEIFMRRVTAGFDHLTGIVSSF